MVDRANLDVWKVIRPSKRHVNTVTGESLSDRQFRQRFLYPGKSLEVVGRELKSERGNPLENYNRLLHARQKYLAGQGITANLREIRKSEGMQSIIKTLHTHTREYRSALRVLDKENKAREKRGLPPKHLTKAQRDKLFGPRSELANALADVGYRDRDARHYVGDS